MPLDGTNFEPRVGQDEVLALLRQARERVAQGWTQGQVFALFDRAIAKRAGERA